MVSAAIALRPQTPNAANVLRSCWIPAPPVGSEPAIVSARATGRAYPRETLDDGNELGGVVNDVAHEDLRTREVETARVGVKDDVHGIRFEGDPAPISRDGRRETL